ncbi:Uncharacterised protein [Bordetella pertussis]|nr:Uncharacterised protein [Bordetella pertussis]
MSRDVDHADRAQAVQVAVDALLQAGKARPVGARQASLGRFQGHDGIADIAGQAQLLAGDGDQALDVVGQHFVAGAVVEVLQRLLQRAVLALRFAHLAFELGHLAGLRLRQRQRLAHVVARLRQLGAQRIETGGHFLAGADELLALQPCGPPQADGQQDDDDKRGNERTVYALALARLARDGLVGGGRARRTRYGAGRSSGGVVCHDAIVFGDGM